MILYMILFEIGFCKRLSCKVLHKNEKFSGVKKRSTFGSLNRNIVRSEARSRATRTGTLTRQTA